MSEVFDGTVDIQDGSGNTTVLLDGSRGALNVGGGGQDGTIHVDDAAGTGRVFIDADGNVTSRDAAATTVWGLYGSVTSTYSGYSAARMSRSSGGSQRQCRCRSAVRAVAVRSTCETTMARTPSFSTAPTGS